MKNYYFVVSFNVQHPRVKEYLEMTMLNYSTMVDYKIRSKLFNEFQETMDEATFDFEMKLEMLYDEGEKTRITFLTVLNPKFSMGANQDTLVSKFANSGTWDENCAAALFFAEDESDDAVESDDEGYEEQLGFQGAGPNAWMCKYELYFVEDKIEYGKNGDYVISPSFSNTSSSYH